MAVDKSGCIRYKSTHMVRITNAAIRSESSINGSRNPLSFPIGLLKGVLKGVLPSLLLLSFDPFLFPVAIAHPAKRSARTKYRFFHFEHRPFT